MTLATNFSSRFSPFTLTLPNGASLSGIHYNPLPSARPFSSFKPLLIGVHSGACSCHHELDICSQYTASTVSTGLGIAFVAIMRPNDAGSTGRLAAENPNRYHVAGWLDLRSRRLLAPRLHPPKGCGRSLESRMDVQVSSLHSTR
jgi:hypothetical protein